MNKFEGSCLNPVIGDTISVLEIGIYKLQYIDDSEGITVNGGYFPVSREDEQQSLDVIEDRMEPELAEEIYETDRCIECVCCVAGCGTILMRDNFTAAVGMNKVARYLIDPRDKRSDEEYYELIGDEDGVFGCMSLMGCEDHCPKELPLQTKIAYMRRKMVSLK